MRVIMEVQHNLPSQPYKKFFGRHESIAKISETLIEGGTFIASIDGIGGIGKTALAYYFCKEKILPTTKFSYLIWLSAKETVFDPFSKDLMIKQIRSNFRGIEELIDTILSVIGFEELINKPLEEKRAFIEEEVIKKEKIFIVLDNLESIEDDQFLNYITSDFNKFAAKNRNLKVLTTSRKRKKIVDFPIEIGGLAAEDALRMLKYLASEYNLKAILNATDHDNIKLIEKVGCIPLGIEFIIGRMSLGKSIGQIYEELQGYPSLDDVKDESEKKEKLSDIILFSFKDMYESLKEAHQYVFKVITSLVRNKSKNDPPISFELLLSLTDYKKSDLDRILETLIDNNLIILLENNEYSMSTMAINFVRQFYEDFGKLEDEIVEKKNKVVRSGYRIPDKVDLFINSTRELIDNNEYEEAETKLLKSLDAIIDHRIYFELAKIQRMLNKFVRAEDSFRQATELNPKDAKIWYEWINMEDNRGRHNIAIQLADKALEKTNNAVSIVNQKVNILKFLKKYEEMRQEVKRYLGIYEKEQRIDEHLRLLRNWKIIEYNLIKDGGYKTDYYFEAIEYLIERDSDLETKIQLSREALRIAERITQKNKIYYLKKKIHALERRIVRDMSTRINALNKLFNNKDYEAAKKEARKILTWVNDDEENIEYAKNALRVLLQILSSENDLERVIMTFADYEEIGYLDKNCKDIYNKAIKEKKRAEDQKLIGEIMFNIQECERILRELIMWSLDNEEVKLIELVRKKDKSEWIVQWQLTKDKALKKDEMLIHYSDLSHIRSILSWVKSYITDKIKDNSNKYPAKEIIKKIVAYLENYISPERQESFHSRLQLHQREDLNNFLVDTRRILEEIRKLESLVGFS